MKEMENWKRALTAASAGLSVICFLKGKRTGGLVFAGVTLATLASEYPDEFRRIRARLPDYVERGVMFLDAASRLGERLADDSQSRGQAWLEALLTGARNVALKV
jgi:hypothetical protein